MSLLERDRAGKGQDGRCDSGVLAGDGEIARMTVRASGGEAGLIRQYAKVTWKAMSRFICLAVRTGNENARPLLSQYLETAGRSDFVPRGEANKGLELEFATEGSGSRPPLKAPFFRQDAGQLFFDRACVHISMVAGNPLEIQIFNLLD